MEITFMLLLNFVVDGDWPSKFIPDYDKNLGN